MQKIIPHLWFNTEAKAAAEFYTSIFPNSKITSSAIMKDTPSGDSEIVSFDLSGFSFMAISAGPYFTANPSISFMVNFDPSRDPAAAEHLEIMWSQLSEGGKALMELGEYPFSKKYGWIQDRFGISWQLMLTNPEGEERPFIIPSLLFTQDKAGKAEVATDYYLSVFKNSRRGALARYPAGMEPDKEGTIMFTDFQIEGQWFAAMDSAHQHAFTFNEGISLLVNCENQEEINYYTDKLSAVPEAEQCGWVKDAYGVSWQMNPSALMDKVMSTGTPEQIARVTQGFLSMKRFDIQKLEELFNG